MLDIEALKKEKGTCTIKAEIISGNEEGIAEIISSDKSVKVRATGKGSGTVGIKISIEKKAYGKVYTFYKIRKVKITKNNNTKEGWLKDKDGKWYYLNNDGIMQRGWVKVNNLWYYLNDCGVMVTGWIKDAGKWYYLKRDGSMAVNTIINGYEIGMDGVWIK